MPAQATDDSADDPRLLAPVVDLASRRAADQNSPQPPAAVPLALDATEGAIQAAKHWRAALRAAGMDFDIPAPPGDVMRAIAAEMERIVGALVYVREGGGPHGLPPNPGIGVDLTSAREYIGVLREMGQAPTIAYQIPRT